MVSLRSVGTRFELDAEVIEGGSGVVRGVVSETEQNQIPAYIFVQQRHVFRTLVPTALKLGMVVRMPSGATYIVGDNGPSEAQEGTIWMSFRLFEVSGRVTWQRRSKIMDPVARVERERPPEDLGLIWVAMEPLDREVFDRKIRASLEQSRFIAGARVLADDIIDGRQVIRSDVQLGIRVGVVT